VPAFHDFSLVLLATKAIGGMSSHNATATATAKAQIDMISCAFVLGCQTTISIRRTVQKKTDIPPSE